MRIIYIYNNDSLKWGKKKVLLLFLVLLFLERENRYLLSFCHSFEAHVGTLWTFLGVYFND